MLNVNILEDEELQDVVNRFISGLLPHDNFDDRYFSEILNILFKYIHLDEFNMEYYVLLKVLDSFNKIQVSVDGYKPRLTRNSLEDTISVSIPNAITQPNIGISEWLAYQGIENNLDIATTKSMACQKLFTRTMDLYDTCFEMSVSSGDVPASSTSLVSALLSHVAEQNVKAQVNILQKSHRLGKHVFSGADDWLVYCSKTVAELDNRINSADTDNVVELDSVEKAVRVLKETTTALIPIAEWGIPQLDDFTPILKHRLVTICGNENIGKTMFLVNSATNALLAGKKVVYMCGESVPGVILSKIIVNYIYKKYKKFIRDTDVINTENCPDSIAKLINISIAEIVGNQSLRLVDTFSYDNVYHEMKDLYDKDPFDAIFIDHSFTLTGGDRLENPICTMARTFRRFKKDFPVSIIVASHLAADVKPMISSDKPVTKAPTRGSSVLAEESDEIFILRDNLMLSKQGLIMIEVYKRRGPAITDPIYLKKKFSVYAFEYSDEYQSANAEISNSVAGALEQLDSLYTDDTSLFSLS